MQNPYKHLASIPFLCCLFLLLVNDFFLKSAVNNAFTGKLSDFCGLFVFSIFWSVLFPKRKAFIFFATAFLFIFWKSPYSTPFINIFSQYVFPIERVVDLSDLIALLVLPFAWKHLSTPQKKAYLSPSLIGLITFLSFCATSRSRPFQRFEQPQYILFQSPGLNSDSVFGSVESRYEYYQFDSLMVIRVSEVDIDEYPVKNDDFQKTLILKDLDKRVANEINLGKQLLVIEKHQKKHRLLVPTHDGYLDSLNFYGSRLDGTFYRFDSLGNLLVRGKYNNGIEDSIWVYLSPGKEISKKKIFNNGELVQIQQYEEGVKVSSENITTRAETIRNKYFQLAVLLTLAIGLIIIIIKSWRNSEYKIAYNTVEKIVYPLLLPVAVVVVINLIYYCITDAYSATGFKIFSDVFLSYAVTTPLFFIILIGIRTGKKIDLLWYVLLFGLLFNLMYESIQLKNFYKDAARYESRINLDKN